MSPQEAAPSGVENSVLGSLAPVIGRWADESGFRLSFLNRRFTRLDAWKQKARRTLWTLIPEKPRRVPLDGEVLERVDAGDHVRERVCFTSAPGVRVPAYLLLPKGRRKPAAAIVGLHDHGYQYYWGKEKLVGVSHEPPVLTRFKRLAYSGLNVATDFCRAGYAVLVIDAFYWGERRLVSADEHTVEQAPGSHPLSAERIAAINARSLRLEEMTARALYQTGQTWQGIWLRDDVRSLDYLQSRPEVDPERIGCFGLSLGGFRSAQLAGMDPRIRCAVVAQWMTTWREIFASRPQVTHFSQFITGAYAHMDLPDLASLCCPGGLLVLQATRDDFFTPRGVADAYARIRAVYDKAGVPSHCRLIQYDSPHRLTRPMFKDSLAWMNRWLAK